VAQAATRAFGLVGLNGIDFVIAEGEAVVLELNPRYCASMELIERAHGRSLFQIHADSCRGELCAPFGEAPPGVLGKGVLWARREVVAAGTRAWLGRHDVRDVPFPGERIGRGRPVCTVLVEGRDLADCRRRLLEAAADRESEILAPAGAATP
jgi:predicted ATP-grasp superfamily ATP-dependent carboligase